MKINNKSLNVPSLYIYKNASEKTRGIKDEMKIDSEKGFSVVTTRFDAVYYKYHEFPTRISYHITHDELLNKKSFIEKQKYIVYVMDSEATASEKEIFNSIDNNISCNVK